jgi:hypothetical protein
MQSIASPRPDRHVLHLVSGTVLGATFVSLGLGLAFEVTATPIVSHLVPASRVNPSQVTIAMLIWALSLIAGGALLVAGTNRLAATVASVRTRGSRLSPVARVLGQLSAEVVVATGVVPNDGRPIPELVVGPFGVAVVHEMASRETIRAMGQSWEARTQEGWVATEHPLDRVARDADRVRHWLGDGDLDFVVRVYAALVTSDTSMARSSACAVITPEQVPAWIEALPRQRSLSAGRRHHLLARVRGAVVDEDARRSR